eukprot:3234807-Prymnesium_polylepis.1
MSKVDEALSPSEALVKRGIFSVSLIIFLDAIAGALGFSVLPYYVENLGGSTTTFGALLSTFSTANIVGSLCTGTASDVFGRKPLLLCSLFGLTLGFAASAFAPSIPMLFVARAVVGFSAGVGSTGRAYLADITSPEQRSKAIASLGGLMMFGYAGGPPIGAAIAGLAGLLGFGKGIVLRTPYFVGAVITLVAMLIIPALMPTVGQIKAAKEAEEEKRSAAASTAAADSKGDGAKAAAEGGTMSRSAMLLLGLMLLANMLSQAGVSCFMVLQPIFIKDAFGATRTPRPESRVPSPATHAGPTRHTRGPHAGRTCREYTRARSAGWGSGQFATMMTTFVLGIAIGQIALFGPVSKKVRLRRDCSKTGV